MIVLSRKKGESIVIDKDISITVIEIRGDKVRLGINAPKELSVHRTDETIPIPTDPKLKDTPGGGY